MNIEITKDPAKKHYYRSGATITAELTSDIPTSHPSEYSYFAVNVQGRRTGESVLNPSKTVESQKVNGTTHTGGTLTATASRSDSEGTNITASVTAYNGFIGGSWYAYTAATFDASASYIYGDKADPNITASFKGGYIRPDVANVITFSSNKVDYIDEQYTVASGTLRYKLQSASTWTSIAFTGASVTLPANTLTSGNTYDFDATILTDDNTSVSVTFEDVSTIDATPTVTAISPSGTVTSGSPTFVWQYSVSTGTAQTAFDLQTSPDGSTWTTIADHVASANSSYTAAVASGTIYWRVRAYNSANVASEWSEALSFVNVAPPDPPTITNINAVGRPSVSWNSADQIAYQVQIIGETVEDSGAVYSTEKTYRSDEYYPDGTYTVKVRVINQYGRTSDWATSEFTISTSLTAPEFTLSHTPSGVQISITGDFETYYIKRNGVLIGQTDGEFTDRFANGTLTYTVIGVDGDDDAQSSQTITAIIEHTSVIAEDGTIYEVNRRMGQPVGISLQTSGVFDTAEYIGAEVPEHSFAKMREKRYSIVFKDYVNVDHLIGKPLFYADIYGNADWCVIVSTGRTESRYGNETTAELQVTKHDEGITYA